METPYLIKRREKKLKISDKKEIKEVLQELKNWGGKRINAGAKKGNSNAKKK